MAVTARSSWSESRATGVFPVEGVRTIQEDGLSAMTINPLAVI